MCVCGFQCTCIYISTGCVCVAHWLCKALLVSLFIHCLRSKVITMATYSYRLTSSRLRKGTLSTSQRRCEDVCVCVV